MQQQLVGLAVHPPFNESPLLGICFLSEVVESIMRGGDRGLGFNMVRFISIEDKNLMQPRGVGQF
jgi:hypothetical protein